MRPAEQREALLLLVVGQREGRVLVELDVVAVEHEGLARRALALLAAVHEHDPLLGRGRAGSSGPRRPRSRCRPARSARRACRPYRPSSFAAAIVGSHRKRGGPRAVEPSSPCRLVATAVDVRASPRGRTGRPGPADVVGVERLLLLRRHLVEQDVRALQRRAAAQVVQRPHLLRVEVQVRLGDQRLAVVADVAHVGDHVGPVPAVVERLPLALADELAHVRGLPALECRPERLGVGPPACLVAVRPPSARRPRP